MRRLIMVNTGLGRKPVDEAVGAIWCVDEYPGDSRWELFWPLARSRDSEDHDGVPLCKYIAGVHKRRRACGGKWIVLSAAHRG